MMPKNRGITRGPSGRFLSNDGNGGGRPKGLAALVQAETRGGAELVAFMLRVLRHDKTPTALRMQAAVWLADRGFGKAVVQLEGSMATTVDATVTHLDGVRAQIRERLTRDDADDIARRLLGH
jgi:hypothetical protein